MHSSLRLPLLLLLLLLPPPSLRSRCRGAQGRDRLRTKRGREIAARQTTHLPPTRVPLPEVDLPPAETKLQVMTAPRQDGTPSFAWQEADLTATRDAVRGSGGGWKGLLATIVGRKSALTAEALAPALEELRRTLISKNVSLAVADTLVRGVVADLEGRPTDVFFSSSSVYSVARKALEDSLERLLTPARPINVLQDVLTARETRKVRRPYTAVLVGVNGVGKSTSLAKLAHYFKAHGLRVALVAADTFRAGAVEQLKTHARALEVPLFERGYGRDAAGVAREGIAWAHQLQCDIVLVDTAGRMQDNRPLMRALAKLIDVNLPDLVLFVGEALAGGDGVDQLLHFNRALTEAAADSAPRLIDGILLTKFDTVGDKVGAAVSLVSSSGVPLLFVGVGQTYGDLRLPSAEAFCRALVG